MLSSRAIAVQGIGYSPALVALQGFLAVADTTAPVDVTGWWLRYPKYRKQTAEEIKQERIRLGIIPDDVEKAVVKAVQTTLEARKVADSSIDLQAAEMELRAYLAQVQKEMVSEYLALLALEFARMEQEYEDFQIAMLLFEM